MPRLDEPNDKVRNEIEEILAAEEKKGHEPIRISRPVKPRRVRVGKPIWWPTPEKLIALGIIILLVGAITRRFLLPLVVTGFVMAGIGYILMVRRGRAAKYGKTSSGNSGGMEPKYWRGRPVDRPNVKTRDGNVVEFPDSMSNKMRRRFGKKR